MITRLFAVSGTVAGFCSVALGAFAAHGLKSSLSPQLLTVFKTAVEYQFFHGLALLLIAFAMTLKPGVRHFMLAGWSILVGILLFSGSLYLMALTATYSLGIITPFGGVAFLIGWIFFTLGAWKSF